MSIARYVVLCLLLQADMILFRLSTIYYYAE